MGISCHRVLHSDGSYMNFFQRTCCSNTFVDFKILQKNRATNRLELTTHGLCFAHNEEHHKNKMEMACQNSHLIGLTHSAEFYLPRKLFITALEGH